MALIKRVVINQNRKCEACKKNILTGSVALKDRRQKYDITPAKKDEQGKVVSKKKIIRDFEKPTLYYHIKCFESEKHTGVI